MKTKHILGLLMVLVAACKGNSGISGNEDSGTAGGGGRALTGGNAGFDGGATGGELLDAAGTDVPTGVAGAGGQTGVDGTSQTGGTMATGGSLASGGAGGLTGTGASAPTCPNGSGCGGDLVGTWQVMSSCLALSGDMDVSKAGLGCKTVPVTGSVQVTGTWTAQPNGSYVDATLTKGSMTFPLAPSCMSVASAPVQCSNMGAVFMALGWTDTMCSQAGDQCFCKAQTTLAGALGMPSPYASGAGEYAISGNTLTVGKQAQYSYCVASSKATLTPKPTLLPVQGTIVLQKIGGGTGGVGGTGGATGGTVGSGGVTGGATGGTVGSGGIVGGAAGTRSTVTGGSGGTSKSSSSGTGGTCTSVTGCGGNLVGIWNVASSCLQVDGEFNSRGTGLGCNTFKVTGSLQVQGSLTLASDGKFQDKTTTTGSVTVSMNKDCLFMSGTWTQCDLISVAVEGLGFSNVRCTDAPGGGCTCPATINQKGNMGLIVAIPETTGNYAAGSSGLLVTGENPLTGATYQYSYCATADRMTVSPAASSPPTKGTIVLQKTSGGATVSEVPPPPPFTGLPLPCEVVAKDGGGAKCVSAHSTVRTIVPGYTGPLYQLCSGGSSPGPGSCKGTAQDIMAKDGYADVDTHEAFCGTESCTITTIYDQSGMGNHLEPSPKGGAKQTPDNPAKAMALPVKINGHKAYGVLIKAGMGYRTGCNGCSMKKTNGMPLGDEPQTVYMVTSQKDAIDGCCFDYGNAETTSNDDGNGTMEAVYFGGGVVWGTGYGGKPGPWVMADLENGLYAGWENGQNKSISTNQALKFDFVTAVLVGDTRDKNSGMGRFALFGADAQGVHASLGKLTCMYDGIRPQITGYVPATKQGSLVLGTSGDNSSGGGGRFYEGATIAGPLVSATTLSLLHAVIVAAKYEDINF